LLRPLGCPKRVPGAGGLTVFDIRQRAIRQGVSTDPTISTILATTIRVIVVAVLVSDVGVGVVVVDSVFAN
jgi:hypothetical protein